MRAIHHSTKNTKLVVREPAQSDSVPQFDGSIELSPISSYTADSPAAYRHSQGKT